MEGREKILYDLYFNKRKSLKEIKKIMKIHDRTINNIFNKYSWEKRPPHKTIKTTVKKYRPYTNREWLYDQYINQNKSCPEIAKEIGCGKNTINFWLNHFCIRARQKGNRKGVGFSDEWKKNLSLSHIGLLTGERNPNWKGGITPENSRIRHSVEYKEWRKKVFERDDYTCQCCGKRGGTLHAHHKQPFCSNKELRLDVENGITLCDKCHYKLHRRVVSTEETILVGA